MRVAPDLFTREVHPPLPTGEPGFAFAANGALVTSVDREGVGRVVVGFGVLGWITLPVKRVPLVGRRFLSLKSEFRIFQVPRRGRQDDNARTLDRMVDRCGDAGATTEAVFKWRLRHKDAERCGVYLTMLFKFRQHAFSSSGCCCAQGASAALSIGGDWAAAVAATTAVRGRG